MYRMDCFGWYTERSCAVLRKVVCKNKICPFYKIKEKLEGERINLEARERARISDKPRKD